MAVSWNQFFLNCSRVIIRPWSDHAPATNPPPLGASTQAATGHDAPDPIWYQSQKNSPDKFTPLFVGSAITRWYKATKENQTLWKQKHKTNQMSNTSCQVLPANVRLFTRFAKRTFVG